MAKNDLSDLDPPFYVVDIETIRDRLNAIRTGFESHFDSVVVGYSYKTNYVPDMLRAVHDAGALAEVVSILEYRLARRLGVPGERIIFNGPNKTYDHIERALEAGSTLNLDSLREVRHVVRWTEETGRGARIGLRANVAHPEFSDHRARSRFGLPDEDLRRAAELASHHDFEITGLHVHLSTKARDLEVFSDLAHRIGEAAEIVGTSELEYVDIGGGIGYAPEGMEGLDFPTFDEYAGCLREVLLDYQLADRTVVVEPGIAMIGDAVDFYTPVRVTKQIGGRDVAFVDGSVHNVKPTKHSHNLPTRVLDEDFEPREGTTKPWDVVGYTCMDDDYIGIDQPLPELETGDILHIGNVGAYTIVFNPPFIRTRPPIYTRRDGVYRTARRPESFDDFFADYELDSGDS